MEGNDHSEGCTVEDRDEVIKLRKQDDKEKYSWNRLLLHYMQLTLTARAKGPEVIQVSDSTATDNSDTEASDTEVSDGVAEGPEQPGTNLIKCNVCSKYLRGTHSLKNHMKRLHGDPNLKTILCDKCASLFYTGYEFSRHYVTHQPFKAYTCKLCGKGYVQKSSLTLHMRYHANDLRYTCPRCGKRFITMDNLKRHQLSHTKRRDFACEPCGCSFVQKDHLKRHMLYRHVGVKTHACPECDKSFIFASQLKAHRRNHLKAPLECERCHKIFKSNVGFQKHALLCNTNQV